MKKFFFITISFFLMACEEKSSEVKNEEEPKKSPKSLTIKHFSLPELSPEAEKSTAEWWDFKTLHQIFTSIAPKENHSFQKLLEKHPDSLVVFKRLFFNKTMLTNCYYERDWRSGENASDTLFRLVKSKSNEPASLSWSENLLKDIPYTFSIRVSGGSLRNVRFSVFRRKDKKVLQEQFIHLDSLEKNEKNPHIVIDTLPDKWLKISTNITTPLTTEHDFILDYDENESAGSYAVFYRSQLSIPMKYTPELERISAQFLPKNGVKSSYNAVYFWLFQLEEQFKQLWAKEKNIPEHLRVPSVKSRLKLFETYVRELADNVKNNPQLTEDELYQSLEKIRHSFSEVILNINRLQEDNIENKMQEVIQKNPAYTSLSNK